MRTCQKCSTELADSAVTCPACGLSIGDESAATAVLPNDQQANTPTKLETPPKRSDPTTTTGGGQFVSGTVLAGRYRIVGRIGKGGMGEVYKAEDLELEQTVALKFLPESLSKNEELLRRFRGEVRNARQVSHRNVCRVFDIGETDGLYYITMEYIDGDDLSMLLRRIGRLPSDKAVDISREICMGLAAIHKAGILHRDLKPANIIIDSKGEARITDFGIAGLETEVQGGEARVGTPAYMSPEQADGKELTRQSDIYSLGLLLYEIFTGKQAYEGESVHELRIKHATTRPKNASEIVAGIDLLVEKVIGRCLEKDPKDRPDSALRVAMSLPGGDPLQVALEAGETPTPEMVAAAPTKGSLKPIAALGLLVGFMGLFTLFIYMASTSQPNGLSPLEKPREVLAERARTIVRNFGYTTPPADTDLKFVQSSEFQRFAKKQENPREWWKRIRSGYPFFYFARYRQSPKELVPQNPSGNILDNDPPFTEPGMINVNLDVTGRLFEFSAIPTSEISPAEKAGQTDWEKVFAEAGLDIRKFKETEPKRLPMIRSDENRLWEGTLADHPDIPVQISGAALNGKPVEFKIIPPWQQPAVGEQGQPEARADTPYGVIIFYSLLYLPIFGALLLIRYNMKNGRVDLKGAVKLAIICFAVGFFAFIIGSDSVAGFQSKLARYAAQLGIALFTPFLLLIYYLAFEPLIRKRCPETLISWNRLVAGDFRNPSIGRDILIGLFLGACFASLEYGLGYLEMYQNPNAMLPLVTTLRSVSFLNGVTSALSNFLMMTMAQDTFLLFWLIFLFLIFLLIFRKKWIAVSGAIIIASFAWAFSFMFGEASVTLFITSVIGNIVLVSCMARFGVVATFALLICTDMNDEFAFTLNTGSFYFPPTAMVFVIMFALALYAFYISLAGQPIFGKGFLEEEST